MKLNEGTWHNITSEAEYMNVRRWGKTKPTKSDMYSAFRVQKGKYAGPGRYLQLRYEQPCPRGCCYDSVGELLTAAEVIEQVKEEMRDLTYVLKRAKGIV